MVLIYVFITANITFFMRVNIKKADDLIPGSSAYVSMSF